MDLTFDHFFGLNETWSVGWSRGTETFPFDPDDGDYATERIELGLRLPYGPWTFEARHIRSDYALTSFGTVSFVPSDGEVEETRLRLSRLLRRGQDSKTTLTGALAWRENIDRVADIVINASSRKLSSLRLGIEHERYWHGGLLGSAFFVEQGLKLFGAEAIDETSPTQPEAQFTLIDASVRYNRAWRLDIGRLSYSGSLGGQYAFDPLHGNYQFNLGGLSSVRGTSRSLLSGARGVLWRNEEGLTPVWQESWPGKLQVYGALDMGHVFEKYSTTVGADNTLIGGSLWGGALGLRLQFDRASVDVAWHRVLGVPGGVDSPGDEVLVSVSTRF